MVLSVTGADKNAAPVFFASFLKKQLFSTYNAIIIYTSFFKDEEIK